MKQVTSFVISEFTNPSGEIVFRIAGWLDGQRIRKNCHSRAEAEAERRVLEVQRLQRETGIRTTVTRLAMRFTTPFVRILRNLKVIVVSGEDRFGFNQLQEAPSDK